MKVSFFENSFATWIDYSNNDDCIGVADLSDRDLEILLSWMDYNLKNIDSNKKCFVEFYEWENWSIIQEKLKKVDLSDAEIEKNIQIIEIKDLWKQGEELRSKYLSAEILPDSELKTETLRILKEKWDLVMTQYIEKQNILIEKYGIEILQEII